MKKPLRNKSQDRYIVRKYVMASSLAEAIRLERTVPAYDAFVDEDWKKSQDFSVKPPIGFKAK